MITLAIIVGYLVGGALTTWLRHLVEPEYHHGYFRIAVSFWFWPFLIVWVLPAWVAKRVGMRVYPTNWS